MTIELTADEARLLFDILVEDADTTYWLNGDDPEVIVGFLNKLAVELGEKPNFSTYFRSVERFIIQRGD